MTKKIIAVVCLLAILVGLFAMAVTQANAAEGSYYVGYNKVDINPYSTLGDPSSGLMALPLRGYGDVWNRLSVADKIDDNGDGKVDENDGLFATCIAVSDAENGGNTVLFISVDLCGSFESLVDMARPLIVKRLNGAVSADQIMITASHTHGAPDIGSMQPSTWTGNGSGNSDKAAAAQANQNLIAWQEQVAEHLADAAKAAMEDRALATLSKGEIDASDSARKVMNSVRHYANQKSYPSPPTYISGDNFNNVGLGSHHAMKQVSDVNDTLYLLQFEFNGQDSKLPIVLANWRAHASMNSVTPYYNNITSDYINAFRYALEYGGDSEQDYRVSFIQGASGNVNPRSRLDSESWLSTTKEGFLAGNTYGPILATVAKACLGSKMQSVQDTGVVRTYQEIYEADRKEITPLMYYAALAQQLETSVTYPYVFPDDAQDVISSIDVSGKDITPIDEVISSREKYVIASGFHASRIRGTYGATDKIDLELNTILLGKGVAFVTAPNELFDRYSSSITWNDIKDKAPSEIKPYVTDTYNDWTNLEDEATYGTPFVLGYCNGHKDYAPNSLAYEYCQGSTTYATGSYEAHNTRLAKGTGEAIIDRFDNMLTTITNDDAYAEVYLTASCEHCGEECTWKPYTGQTGSGHYYLSEDYTTEQISLPEGSSICLDLKGHSLTSVTRRVFATSKDTGVTLSIMDSSAGQTGVVQGTGTTISSTAWAGGTIFVAKGCELNLYGGTLTASFQPGYAATYGGVIGARGTVNVYGGKISGGTVAVYKSGDNDYTAARGATINLLAGSSDGCGTLNMYGGTIEQGTFKAFEKVDGVLNEITDTDTQWRDHAYGRCVFVDRYTDTYKGTVNLLDREVDGTVVPSHIDNIYFRLDTRAARCLNVKGNYQGSVELSNMGTVESGTVVGAAVADEGGQAADTTYANITFADAANLRAVVSGTQLVASPVKPCQMCGEASPQWKLMNHLDPDQTKDMAPGHYILTGDFDTVQKVLGVDGVYCVDLAGNTFTGATRAFYAKTGATLNIMDSVGDGVVQGKNSGTTAGGGVLYTENGTINLHSGTVRHFEGCQVQNGGAVRVNGGTFHIVGGTVEGSDVTGYGCAVYVTKNGDTKGVFGASGGQVVSGTAGKNGPCVYIANDGSEAALSGSAQVADIYFAGSSANTLSINGAFNGSVQLSYPTAPAANTVIGKCAEGTTLSGVTLNGSELKVLPVGTDLVAQNVDAVAVYDPNGELEKYNSIQEALDGYTYSKDSLNYIKLFADTDEAITVSKDVYLDLNGCDITGLVTVDEAGNLYCMDSKTDNYDSTYNDCGKLKNIAKGSIVNPVPLGSVSAVGNEDKVRAGYMMLTNDDGVSFHRYYQDVSYYNLQTTGDGMYFTAGFYGDEVIKQAITENGRFGVALAIKDLADDAAWIAGIEDTKESGRTVLYSAYNGTSFSSGAEVNSTVLKNIMSNANGSIINDRNARTRVYGRPYIQIGNQYYFGDVVDDPDGRGETDDNYDFNTLKGLVKYMNDKMWDGLKEAQKTAVMDMYERYPVVLGDWGVNNIKQAVKDRKANG